VTPLRILTLVAIAAVAFAVGWIGGLGFQRGYWTEVTAAWVQAVGTVVAIAATAWTAQTPIRAEADRRRQARADFINALTDSAELSLRGVDRLRSAMAGQGNFTAACQSLNDADAAVLRKLLDGAIDTWPSARLYFHAERFLQAVREFTSVARGVCDTYEADTAQQYEMAVVSHALAKAHEELRQAIEEFKV